MDPSSDRMTLRVSLCRGRFRQRTCLRYWFRICAKVGPSIEKNRRGRDDYKAPRTNPWEGEACGAVVTATAVLEELGRGITEIEGPAHAFHVYVHGVPSDGLALLLVFLAIMPRRPSSLFEPLMLFVGDGLATS